MCVVDYLSVAKLLVQILKSDIRFDSLNDVRDYPPKILVYVKRCQTASSSDLQLEVTGLDKKFSFLQLPKLGKNNTMYT